MSLNITPTICNSTSIIETTEIDIMLSTSKDTNGINRFTLLEADQIVNLLKHFNLKELGTICQTCRQFSLLSSTQSIWQTLCEKNPDVEMKQLVVYDNNYKELYKEETELTKFFEGHVTKFYFMDGRSRNTFTIVFNNKHSALLVKHIFKMVERTLHKGVKIDYSKKKIVIINDGVFLKPDDQVCKIKLVNGCLVAAIMSK